MKKKLVLLLTTAMVVTMFTGCGNKVPMADDEFILELGDNPQFHTQSYVDVKSEEELNKIDFDFSDVNYMKVGEYTATATYKKKSQDFTINVEDTTAPDVVLKDKLQAGVATPLYVKDMVEKFTELGGAIQVSFKDSVYTEVASVSKSEEDTKEEKTDKVSEETENTEKKSESTEKEESTEAKVVIDENVIPEYNNIAVVYAQAGEYDNVMTLEDAEGNKKDIDLHIVVSDLPKITNATDIIAEKGSTIDYMYGVTATDNAGNDITSKITVDSSKVDVNTVGSYEVTYTVTDDNGISNTAVITVQITENIAETVENTDNATPARVTIASTGTGTVAEKKQEVAEQKNQQSASNSSSNGTSSNSGTKKPSSSKPSGGNTSNNGGSSSNNGGGSATSPNTPSAPSKPAVAAQQVGEWSGTNGALNGTQKAYVDGLVRTWRNGGYTDRELNNEIANYLFDQGIEFSSSGVSGNASSLVNNLSEISIIQSNDQDSNAVYSYVSTSTKGEYDGDYLVAYEWSVGFY